MERETPRSIKIGSAIILAIVIAMAGLAALGDVVSFQQVWNNEATNATAWIPTNSGNEAQVTIAGVGGFDGTVTVYTCPAKDVDSCVAVVTKVSPTTATTYVGTSSALLYLTITGRTVGTTDVYVVLKG
jgi:hypothetical protein